MNSSHPQSPPDEKQLRAYEQMLGRALTELKKREHEAGALQRSIDAAKERAVELGELSRPQAERLAVYVRRDLEDAGKHLATSGEDLKNWFQFDMQLIEAQLLEMFMEAADQTKLAYLQLAREARDDVQYQSGEVTTVGTLQCINCGESMHFHTTGHIPPCPQCYRTTFVRKG